MPRLQPWWQGDLDALCGPYAVLNATKLLVPEARDIDLALTLFGILITSFAKAGNLKQAVAAGTDCRQVGTAITCIGKALGRRGLGNLRWSRPLGRRHGLTTLPRFWQAMHDLLHAPSATGSARVLIIAWEGHDPHWTVVRRISKSHLHLFDSGGTTKLQRRRCTIDPDIAGRPYWLLSFQVLLVERIPPAP